MARRDVVLGLNGRTVVALTGAGTDLGVTIRTEVRARESQPYHDAQGLPIDAAERFIADAAEAAEARATSGLRQVLDDLAAQGFHATHAGIFARQYRLPGSVAAILRSHPACHAAEGQMTIDALLAACAGLGLEIVAMTEERVDPRVDPVGKLIGPPWRKEHKVAATAALHALATR